MIKWALSLLIVVRINDRGPFVKNRVIDLSQAAAQ
jgi:rare lipoprotein A